MKPRHLLIVLALLGRAGAALGDSPPPLLLDEVLDKMSLQQEQIQDIQAGFVEELRRGDLPAETVRGKIFMQRPDHFRVAQAHPEKQVIISDGKLLKIYMPAQKQVLSGDWKAWLKSSHFPIEAFDFIGQWTPEHWRAHYQAFLEGYEAPNYRLLFRPNSAEDVPLTVWISGQTFLPVRVTLRDGDTRADVSLSDIKVNQGFKESTFSLNVPAGTVTVPLTF